MRNLDLALTDSAGTGNTANSATPELIVNHRRISLVSLVTENRQRLFDELLLARMVVRSLKQQRMADTLAYVVLPDMLHWLIELKEGPTLASVVLRAKKDSASRVNAFYGRNGAVWQPGFQKHSVQKQDDLKYIARQIIKSPLRAGLANSVRAWSHWDAVWV